MDFLKKKAFHQNENILHNKYILYFIFILSFGNFFIEMMNGDMYFVTIYIIIGFLTSFFNKNMIVILSISVIFANILKYGRASTLEGFDGEKNEVDKALTNDTSNEGNAIDKLVDGTEKEKDKDDDDDEEKEGKHKEKKHKEKKEKKEKKKHESDSESDSDSDDEGKKKKKKKTKDGFTDKELKNMDYEQTDQLLENQKIFLKNMKQYKPFLDTMQGIAKSMSGFVKEKGTE